MDSFYKITWNALSSSPNIFPIITLAEYNITSSLFNLREWLLPNDARLRAARGSAWHNNILCHKLEEWMMNYNGTAKMHNGRSWKKCITYLRACCYNQQIFWSIAINIFHLNLIRIRAQGINNLVGIISKRFSDR